LSESEIGSDNDTGFKPAWQGQLVGEQQGDFNVGYLIFGRDILTLVCFPGIESLDRIMNLRL